MRTMHRFQIWREDGCSRWRSSMGGKHGIGAKKITGTLCRSLIQLKARGTSCNFPPPSRFCLGRQVGEALSSVHKSPGTRDVMLRDAHSLFRGIPKPKSDSGPTRGDGSQDSLLRAEADYLQLLLGQNNTHDGSSTGKSWWFSCFTDYLFVRSWLAC